jgi:hypothetical protein
MVARDRRCMTTAELLAPAPSALTERRFNAPAGRAIALMPLLPVAAFLLARSEPDLLTPAWCGDDTLWQDATDGIELSVVIPFYNPGDSMRPTVQRLVDGMRRTGSGFELICVSDGSTDGSEASLDGIGPEVRVLVNPANRGKGAALHTGFAHARGSWIGMVDADGDIDPLHLVDYLERAQAENAEVVYADKRLGASTSASSPVRKLVSFGFSSLVGTLFGLGVRDTQTGCKLFSRRTLQQVLPRLREERFAFDLEFFVAAKAAGVARLVSAPVHLSERLAGSSVTAVTILRTLVDALTVFGRLHLRPTYRIAQRPAAPVADARPVERAATVRIPAQRVPVASDERIAA